MREYLDVFADVKYLIVDAVGTGTCSGVKQAIDYIPQNESFMLVWSDLILPKKIVLPEEYETANGIPKVDYVGVSQTFPCRWKYENGEFSEEKSVEHGVAGFFLFTDKSKIAREWFEALKESISALKKNQIESLSENKNLSLFYIILLINFPCLLGE